MFHYGIIQLLVYFVAGHSQLILLLLLGQHNNGMQEIQLLTKEHFHGFGRHLGRSNPLVDEINQRKVHRLAWEDLDVFVFLRRP